jgi:hypothetical protein
MEVCRPVRCGRSLPARARRGGRGDLRKGTDQPHSLWTFQPPRVWTTGRLTNSYIYHSALHLTTLRRLARCALRCHSLLTLAFSRRLFVPCRFPLFSPGVRTSQPFALSAPNHHTTAAVSLRLRHPTTPFYDATATLSTTPPTLRLTRPQ